MKSIEDVCTAAGIANSDVAMVGRLNSALAGVVADQGKGAKITGLIAKSANLGYIVGRIGTETVFVADLVGLNANVGGIIPLDIDVPQGATFSLAHHSTSGTAVATASIFYEK